MLKSRFFVFKSSFLLLVIVLSSHFVNAQLLELDYTAERREESSFRIHLIRYGIIGVSSLQHLDLTAEVLKMRYDAKNGWYIGFSVFGTQTIWRGNKVDALNTFDFIMNPIGGTVNGNFFTKIPLKRSKTENSNIGLSLGSKWIQGPPAPNFRNNSFFDHYLRLGWIHQRLLAEDALTNSSLSFWAFPHIQFHQSSAESRKLYFNDQIDPLAQGYGIELGIEYNTQLKITLHGQQLLNTKPEGEFNRFVTRLVIAYRF
ncbi:hypothetical protein N9H57_04500 [Flavobacteriaceae bacterium]|nr:hypothetical protein [Flavobacteriaceae bacterium]MDB3862251.1 hypothetical protein [Flavobacteriaceae bacterium]